jgi:hypothetical protein
MYIDGITLTAGSSISEDVLNQSDVVTSLPGTVTNGRIVKLTQQDGANAPGLYMGVTGVWVAQADNIDEKIQTAVDAAVAGIDVSAKADLSYVNTQLASKADASATTSALASKADSSTVTSGLAAKADSSSVTALQFADVAMNVVGKPDLGAIVLQLVTPRAITIPASFTGSKAVAAVASTSSAVFTIKRWNTAYSSSTTLGTITFSAGNKVGVIAQSGSGTMPFAVGETLEITAPSPQDSTLASIAITIASALG